MQTFYPEHDPDDCVMMIQSFMNQQGGWVLSHKDEKSMIYTRTRKPRILITILLLFIWIVPGVLYLIFAWGKDTCSIYVKEHEKGSKVTVDAGKLTSTLSNQIAKHLGTAIQRQSGNGEESALMQAIKDRMWIYAMIGAFLIFLLVIYILFR
jgi:uncharacterized protein YxeA